MASTFFDYGSFRAGDTVGPISLSYPDYPRSGGWSLVCIIAGIGGDSDRMEVSATDGTDPDGFSLTIPAATTAPIPGGRKAVVIQAVHASNGKFTAEECTVIVRPNPRVTTAEMTILSNIRAVITGLASDGQQTTALDGVQLRHMSPEQLADWEARYIKIVNGQIGRAGGNGGVYAIKHRTPQDNRYAAPFYGAYPSGGVR